MVTTAPVSTPRRQFIYTADGLEHIRQALAGNPEAPQLPPGGLPLQDITVCEVVFQRRDIAANRLVSDEHVRDLKRAIQEDPDQMEPVSVWWGGDGWYLIDGHHRVRAYESAGFTGPVSCRVVSGSLEDALAHVGIANTRNKLPMNKEERMDLAVFYVCLCPEKSVRDIARVSGAGKSSVSTIKKVIMQLVERGEPREKLMDEPWNELRRMARDEPHRDFDFDQERKVITQEICQKLKPILGKKPHRHAEAMADAIRQISPGLWQGIVDMVQQPEEDDLGDLEDDEY